MRRLPRWKLFLPAVAVSFFVLSMTQVSNRSGSGPAIPVKPPPSFDEQRFQAAEEAAKSFMAAPTELERTRRVLISFDRDVTLENALTALAPVAPGLKVLVVNYSILDSIGIRHSMFIFIAEDEDPVAKAKTFLPGTIETQREQAREQLRSLNTSNNEKSDEENCYKVEMDVTCDGLIAKANLNGDQARLDGISVEMSGQSVLNVLNAKGELGVLAVEEESGTRIPSPIIPEKE